MKIFGDLHTHSTASDGQYRPGQVAAMAADLGIQAFALTDHDTMEGLAQAREICMDRGLIFLRGIELSAREYPCLHLLGYGFSDHAPHLTELCGKMKQSRDERKYRIIDYLREKGVDISLEEVEQTAGGSIIGRPHFAQVMVKHGYVRSNQEAFDRYLATEEFQRIERFKPSARECIAAVRADGGHVSMAHPYQVGLDTAGLDRLIAELCGDGLEALECFYSLHTPAQTESFLALAKKYGLHVTGGSDFHGERVKPHISLKKWELDLQWLLECTV